MFGSNLSDPVPEEGSRSASLKSRKLVILNADDFTGLWSWICYRPCRKINTKPQKITLVPVQAMKACGRAVSISKYPRSTHTAYSWVDPRAGVDTRRYISCPRRESKHDSTDIQRDWAVEDPQSAYQVLFHSNHIAICQILTWQLTRLYIFGMLGGGGAEIF